MPYGGIQSMKKAAQSCSIPHEWAAAEKPRQDRHKGRCCEKSVEAIENSPMAGYYAARIFNGKISFKSRFNKVSGLRNYCNAGAK